jgi:Ca2+/Na+ antiporter
MDPMLSVCPSIAGGLALLAAGALILDVAALARPLRVRSALLRREMPILVGATVVFAWMLRDGTLSRTDGAVLVVGAVVYLLSSTWRQDATRTPMWWSSSRRRFQGRRLRR